MFFWGLPEGEKAASLQWADIGRPSVGMGLDCPMEGTLSRLMLGLPEIGQTFNVLRMGSACSQYFEVWACLKARRQQAFQWVDIGRPSLGRDGIVGRIHGHAHRI